MPMRRHHRRALAIACLAAGACTSTPASTPDRLHFGAGGIGGASWLELYRNGNRPEPTDKDADGPLRGGYLEASVESGDALWLLRAHYLRAELDTTAGNTADLDFWLLGALYSPVRWGGDIAVRPLLGAVVGGAHLQSAIPTDGGNDSAVIGPAGGFELDLFGHAVVDVLLVGCYGGEPGDTELASGMAMVTAGVRF